MKKMIIAVLICLVVAGTAFAIATPSEEDYKNLDEMRAKLVRMRREMDKFMRDVITAYPEDTNKWAGYGADVRVDVTETPENILVKADLPGMDKDKIDVTLERGKVLKISGIRDIAKSETSPGVVVKERMQGKFERAIELPAECMSDGIKADYRNGVLELVIPKKKISKQETVKIRVD